jgi:DNA gyrase subunit A
VFIEDEMKNSYLDYSMSMLTARALPHVRDGLKPVHRRVLVGMNDAGLAHNRPHKKCANVVGNVMAKYHPHGDMAIYDTLVRMAQPFSMRYTVVDGQGNFGSIDGDPPAAYRYTECRMTQMAEQILVDLEKDTVDFVTNYDDTAKEPSVLPTRIPYLLLNGSTGIAVGMATNMAPHNLHEVVDALTAMIDNPDITVQELMQIIPGPDFPTGGIILGRSGIKSAYETGRGKIYLRARAEVVEKPGDKEEIVITEIPYMVNKSSLLEKIGDLVKQKTVEGISFIRDESDRSGLRVVIGVKKDDYGEVVLNKLYKYTQLQTTFGVNNLALVDMRPQCLGLRDLLWHFVEHRHEVVTRRTQFELDKAQRRAHILEGLRVAIDNIDEVVAIIRHSASPEDAHNRLMERFTLSEEQVKAILNMRLQRLTALEKDKIEQEYRELLEKIDHYEKVLANRQMRMDIIKQELAEVKGAFGDERRTNIVDDYRDVNIEDMIADEDMVITMTHEGYIKRCAATVYRAQSRGGKGVKGMQSKDTDFVAHIFVGSAHSHVLFFTNTGRCYVLKVYQIPEAGRNSRGRSIVNLLQLREDEHVASLIPVKQFDETRFIMLATRNGIINKQPLSAYANVRRIGVNAISLDEHDRVIRCAITDGSKEIMLGTYKGRAVRFHESTVRQLGRNTRGIKGVALRGDDHVIDLAVVHEHDTVLTVTENGYGKRTGVGEYRKTNRATGGVINIKCSDRNGNVVALKRISGPRDVMLITRKGIIIRSDALSISCIGRNTNGIKLINLSKDDTVIAVAVCNKQEEMPDDLPGEIAEEPTQQEPETGSDNQRSDRPA